MDFRDIVRINIGFYERIKPKNPPNSYTVIATLNDYQTGELLCVATGTQATNKTYPDDIEDCHAESLLKRAYKKYLISRSLGLISSQDKRTSRNDIICKVKQECCQDLVLFISQFPCGLVKRYEGYDLRHEEDGSVNCRKPGRGCYRNGQVIYVSKENCFLKLRRWLLNGFQGSNFKSLFDVRCRIRKIIIGDCEPDKGLNYELYVNQMKNELAQHIGCELEPEISLIDNISRDEFVFDQQKQPQPIALVWWFDISCSVPNYEFEASFHHKFVSNCSAGKIELVVDGRKRGLTKKQCQRDDVKLKLGISTRRLREDWLFLEQTMQKFTDP